MSFIPISKDSPSTKAKLKFTQPAYVFSGSPLNTTFGNAALILLIKRSLSLSICFLKNNRIFGNKSLQIFLIQDIGPKVNGIRKKSADAQTDGGLF